MHRLRPSVLLRRPREIVVAALVVATQTLFLWMFLAADPLEQAVNSAAALRFASDWRHGMTGNSFLYMPGFFATAGALWLFRGTGHRSRLAGPLLALCAIAAVAALLGAAGGARMAASDFETLTLTPVPGLPRPSLPGAARGLYTLATWSVFVLACRSALERRTWRPFVLPGIMAIGLAVIRPWTVGDFTSLWRDRATAGDPVACASAAAAIGMIVLLARASSQRSQSRSNPTCAAGTRRAETTSSR